MLLKLVKLFDNKMIAIAVKTHAGDTVLVA